MTDATGMAGRPVDDENRAHADREATDWLVMLQEDADDFALRARFESWLSADPANAAAWADICHLSQLIRAAPLTHAGFRRSRPVMQGRSMVSSAVTPKRSVSPHRPTSRLAVNFSAAAAVCFLVMAGANYRTRMQADEIASVGEIRTVRLEDGSVVRLAAGSALAIDYAPAERKVRLLRGNAYFEITHDPRRPFQVAVAQATATALGTAFEIRREPDGVAVAVRRGRVRIDCDDDSSPSEFLMTGQAVDLDCRTDARRTRVDPQRVATWVSGQLIANDRPMREIVDALRPWYSGIIIERGVGLDRNRVTGVYDLRNPEKALAAVAEAHQASLYKITPWITVIAAD